MYTRALLAAAVLLLSACAPAAQYASDDSTVLCVSNETAGYGTLRIRAGMVSMRIEPGQRQCKRLDGTGHAGVTGSTIGGGALGPIRLRDAVPLDGRCWSWTVSNGMPGFPVPCEVDRGAR
jgi:hypothetical protein